ncbi:EamA family transporter [Hansschlegelia zhihuaiae]|uniref:EamA family transporter n=1 Tax=Hansschlegelia zhihuaiae TaxID=405005 RepID=A0A4Q0MR15_9HYPH|nr:EamA family transporter [Hansschlegelia zhihuaiae]RXF75586.1 EamA family transporter [Hansschlegelia zhihuaiae]
MTARPLASPLESASALLPVAAVVGSVIALCVGTSFAKHLFGAVGAEGVTALRVTIAAIMLSAIWRPWQGRLSLKDASRVALFGVTLGVMNLCFYMAIRSIPLGLAIAIEFTGPLAVALASSRRGLDLLWIALAAPGLGLLLPLGHGVSALDPAGVGFALAAAVCWALYIVQGSRLGHLHGGRAIALAMTAAAAVTLPIGVAAAGAALVDPNVLLIALGVAALSSALPYSLEIYALPRLPRQTFGVLLSLEPAVGSLAGLAILGERLAATEWAAIGAIVLASAGAAATARRSRTTHPESEPEAASS